MLHANLMALFYRSGVMADNSLHCRNTHFRPVCSSDLYLDPMTFKYELDSYSQQIYWMCENELRMSSLSKVIVLQPVNACIQLHMVTAGHVTKMAVIPLEPS